jgi:hypothetical protein
VCCFLSSCSRPRSPSFLSLLSSASLPFVSIAPFSLPALSFLVLLVLRSDGSLCVNVVESLFVLLLLPVLRRPSQSRTCTFVQRMLPAPLVRLCFSLVFASSLFHPFFFTLIFSVSFFFVTRFASRPLW